MIIKIAVALMAGAFLLVPLQVTDLRITETTHSTVELHWTVPSGIPLPPVEIFPPEEVPPDDIGIGGDDGDAPPIPPPPPPPPPPLVDPGGRIGMTYDLRMSTQLIVDEATFEGATRILSVPLVGTERQQQSCFVGAAYGTPLQPDTFYVFALRIGETSAGPWGPISNIVSTTTLATPPDITPPSAIVLNAMTPAPIDRVELRWTAPGDDGATGTALLYDLRYSEGPITDPTSFGLAIPVAGLPAPRLSGTAETFTVTGLLPGTLYFFAIVAIDDAFHPGARSNSASATTEADLIAPSSISDLAVVWIGETSVILSWTAPSDNVQRRGAALYDLRYSSVGTIRTDAEFAAATPIAGEPVPGPAGRRESITVTNLGRETRFSFAIRTTDFSFNWSSVSNGVDVMTEAGGSLAGNSPCPMTARGGSGAMILLAGAILATGRIRFPVSRARRSL